ncbi:E3 ubiquitin-protein ligase SP1-like [Lolium rigidum]|uniref:E3 ubiquitin-protein ligase SP1-like n=1 Tax=Lolium rigidum TaxID=89674 RepID=UPI001F5E2717|nr:E3 ubiquitin-protein ligase SP1-like isoform X2 [Lolium rigidum]XP_047067688.1 E3 ubiquitin-protein ligase SP1-like [Lolium rigidum]XP_051214013.1 E3 ubiquitin-protein ligase SP1 [Lolium perenne]
MMIPWGGVGCCLSAAALYLLGRSSGRDAEVLRSVARTGSLKDLAAILDAASKVLPLVVAVSGRVSSDTPLVCQQSGMRGVIVEETAEQHFLKHNDAGSWIQDSAVMLSVSKEVPWYLDDGTGRVYVVGARSAAGLVLTVASEVFEESGRTLVRGTLDYLQGLKMLGVKRTERVLPTGTSLTVVGEAIKDDVGTIRIQRPHKGPFYASPKSIDQLILNLGKWAKLYKLASMGFAAFGVFLLAKRALEHFLQKKRQHEFHRKARAAAAQRQAREAEDGTSGGEPNSKKDQLVLEICVICLEQEYNAVFVPCGHMCCCMTCSSHVTNCPLCRRRIDQAVRTFRH